MASLTTTPCISCGDCTKFPDACHCWYHRNNAFDQLAGLRNAAEIAQCRERSSKEVGWAALDLVLEERKAQDIKWGKQSHSDLYWLGILAEEFGELAKEIIESNGSKAIESELVQVAAVAVAWIEQILEAK